MGASRTVDNTLYEEGLQLLHDGARLLRRREIRLVTKTAGDRHGKQTQIVSAPSITPRRVDRDRRRDARRLFPADWTGESRRDCFATFSNITGAKSSSGRSFKARRGRSTPTARRRGSGCSTAISRSPSASRIFMSASARTRDGAGSADISRASKLRRTSRAELYRRRNRAACQCRGDCNCSTARRTADHRAAADPFLDTETDKVLKEPDWSRLALWDKLRARWFGLREPDTRRSGRKTHRAAADTPRFRFQFPRLRLKGETSCR